MNWSDACSICFLSLSFFITTTHMDVNFLFLTLLTLSRMHGYIFVVYESEW